MPYIKEEYRPELDKLIDQLSSNIVYYSKQIGEETSYAGLLNYTCTTLAMQIIEKQFGKIRYGTIATVTGVFKNIADEFYRRVAAPYEDLQVEKNGDVPLYQKFGK